MQIPTDDFRVREGETVRLAKQPTRIAAPYASEDDGKAMLGDHVAALSGLQQRLYAAGTRALLLVFQAMDAGGKDGTIGHVMSGVNPQGCQVVSFKQPSATELQHDFLWRCARQLPERGRIGIFNRSYYEDVLIVRVHPELLGAEGVAGERRKKLWHHRYRSIIDFERHLHDGGTQILKFYLHLSPQEQARRFVARIDDPAKNWKITPADIEERRHWDDYMRAYEQCLGATSTRHAPWYVVPADDKPTARLIVSQVIVDALKAMRLTPPPTSQERHHELLAMRAQLQS